MPIFHYIIHGVQRLMVEHSVEAPSEVDAFAIINDEAEELLLNGDHSQWPTVVSIELERESDGQDVER